MNNNLLVKKNRKFICWMFPNFWAILSLQIIHICIFLKGLFVCIITISYKLHLLFFYHMQSGLSICISTISKSRPTWSRMRRTTFSAIYLMLSSVISTVSPRHVVPPAVVAMDAHDRGRDVMTAYWRETHTSAHARSLRRPPPGSDSRSRQSMIRPASILSPRILVISSSMGKDWKYQQNKYQLLLLYKNVNVY